MLHDHWNIIDADQVIIAWVEAQDGKKTSAGSTSGGGTVLPIADPMLSGRLDLLCHKYVSKYSAASEVSYPNRPFYHYRKIICFVDLSVSSCIQ